MYNFFGHKHLAGNYGFHGIAKRKESDGRHMQLSGCNV